MSIADGAGKDVQHGEITATDRSMATRGLTFLGMNGNFAEITTWPLSVIENTAERLS